MNKMDQQILAVPTDKLSEIITGAAKNNDFYPIKDEDSYEDVLEDAVIRRRGDLEIDPNFKQLIPYIAVSYEGKLLYYLRANGGGDTRLHQKMSIGLGGHVEAVDVEATEETILSTAIREVKEEVGEHVELLNLKPLGYISSERSEVETVHLGILFTAELSTNQLEIDPEEIAQAEFVTLEELDKLISSDKYDVENWTQIVWPEIKSRFT